MSNWPLRPNLSKTELLISSPNSLYELSHLSYGNSIIHVAQAKTLTLSLNLFFVSLLLSHIQSVMRSSWLYFQILYQRADHFLLPPPLPLWTKLRLSFTWVAPEAFVQPSCFYPSPCPTSLPHVFSAQQLKEFFQKCKLSLIINSSAQNFPRLPISLKPKTKVLAMPARLNMTLFH